MKASDLPCKHTSRHMWQLVIIKSLRNNLLYLFIYFYFYSFIYSLNAKFYSLKFHLLWCLQVNGIHLNDWVLSEALIHQSRSPALNVSINIDEICVRASPRSINGAACVTTNQTRVARRTSFFPFSHNACTRRDHRHGDHRDYPRLSATKSFRRKSPEALIWDVAHVRPGRLKTSDSTSALWL